MTVKELKQKLELMEDDAEVAIVAENLLACATMTKDLEDKKVTSVRFIEVP